MPKKVLFASVPSPENPWLTASARVRRWSLALNATLIAAAVGVIAAIMVVYIYQPWLSVINALHEMISAHITLVVLLVLGTISTILGGVGLFTIRKHSTLILGLQIFALIILAALEVGALYGFLKHWIANLSVSVTYAVQLFRPGQLDQANIAAIQRTLHCCGRASYSDYYIANEDIPMNYAPFSCCDIHQYGLEACQNSSMTTRKGKVGTNPKPGIATDRLIVPEKMVFDRGCHFALQIKFLPFILLLFSTLLLFNLITAFINSLYIHYSSKAETVAVDLMNKALEFDHSSKTD